MTLDQLKAFLAVVEHGSIRAGARSLDVAQSGLTKQVRRLEQSLGASLFVRANSGIVLTNHGNTLLARARIILGECERAEQDFQSLRGQLSGRLNVGASSEAFARFLPQCIAQLRDQHPAVSVHVASGPSTTLLSGIREGRLDFAVTLVSKGSDMTDLRSDRLTASRPRILCRKGHPLRPATSIRELVGSDWVNTARLGEEGTPSNRLGDWFKLNGLPEPNIAISVESLLDTLNLITSSDFLFLGPEFVLQQSGFEYKLSALDIAEPIPYSDLCVVQRAAVPLAPAAQALASMLISYGRMSEKARAPAV